MYDDKVYYRVLVYPNEVVVACMQWFDEYDYDKSSRLNDKKYASEEEAEVVASLARAVLNRPLTLQDKKRIVLFLLKEEGANADKIMECMFED